MLPLRHSSREIQLRNLEHVVNHRVLYCKGYREQETSLCFAPVHIYPLAKASVGSHVNNTCV